MVGEESEGEGDGGYEAFGVCEDPVEYKNDKDRPVAKASLDEDNEQDKIVIRMEDVARTDEFLPEIEIGGDCRPCFESNFSSAFGGISSSCHHG